MDLKRRNNDWIYSSVVLLEHLDKLIVIKLSITILKEVNIVDNRIACHLSQ